VRGKGEEEEEVQSIWEEEEVPGMWEEEGAQVLKPMERRRCKVYGKEEKV